MRRREALLLSCTGGHGRGQTLVRHWQCHGWSLSKSLCLFPFALVGDSGPFVSLPRGLLPVESRRCPPTFRGHRPRPSAHTELLVDKPHHQPGSLERSLLIDTNISRHPPVRRHAGMTEADRSQCPLRTTTSPRGRIAEGRVQNPGAMPRAGGQGDGTIQGRAVPDARAVHPGLHGGQLLLPKFGSKLHRHAPTLGVQVTASLLLLAPPNPELGVPPHLQVFALLQHVGCCRGTKNQPARSIPWEDTSRLKLPVLSRQQGVAKTGTRPPGLLPFPLPSFLLLATIPRTSTAALLATSAPSSRH